MTARRLLYTVMACTVLTSCSEISFAPNDSTEETGDLAEVQPTGDGLDALDASDGPSDTLEHDLLTDLDGRTSDLPEGADSLDAATSEDQNEVDVADTGSHLDSQGSDLLSDADSAVLLDIDSQTDVDGDVTTPPNNFCLASAPTTYSWEVANPVGPVPRDWSVATSSLLPPIFGTSSGGQLADLNGDGTLDLVVSRISFSNQVFVNHEGRFMDVTAEVMPQEVTWAGATPDVAVGDLNGDGRPDVLFPRGAGTGEDAHIYQNVGTETESEFALEELTLSEVADDVLNWNRVNRAQILDLDDDGDNDILLARGLSNILYENQCCDAIDCICQRPYFTMHRLDNVYARRGWAVDLATADFDGDGFPEVAVANTYCVNAGWDCNPSQEAGMDPPLHLYGYDVETESFVDRALEAGLHPDTPRYASAIVAIDDDRDGDQDILLFAGPTLSDEVKRAISCHFEANDWPTNIADPCDMEEPPAQWQSIRFENVSTPGALAFEQSEITFLDPFLVIRQALAVDVDGNGWDELVLDTSLTPQFPRQAITVFEGSETGWEPQPCAGLVGAAGGTGLSGRLLGAQLDEDDNTDLV
ncbi:MAG: VCBS repeat-containing protein, partial [Myxococcales bacterium]|nr:VCBS repeat-containing protein [Myxococcales bacterium]